MSAQYGTAAQDIVAAIGPSIGPDHYPVGSEVVEQMRLSFKDSTDLVLENINGKTHLDLWKANQLTLEEAGVTQVEVAGICTQCHADDWYSHRCEQGKTGRFGIILGLE
jgi:copper oxidase (laccase) domain-containing protein